jgi:hypothetical protein
MENSLEDRISFYVADFVRDQLPNEYDMILYCDVGIFSEALVHKFWSALNQGGRLVIVDYFAPTEGVAPKERLYWTFQVSIADPAVSVMTVAALSHQLIDVGFQLRSENIVLPCGRVVIQADK